MLSIIVSAVLVSAVTLVQSQDNCSCSSYFDCYGPSVPSDKCPGEFDICCYSNITSTTEGPSQTNVGPIPRNCGTRDSSGVADRIVGGDRTEPGEFPWMVAVMKVKPDGSQEFLCGGSIITPTIILTTTHNVRNNDASTLVVKAGVCDATYPDEALYHQTRSVSKIILHPGYVDSKITIVVKKNDIAKLVLEKPLTFTKNVNAICLPSPELQVNYSECIATGWGGRANFEDSINGHSIMNKVVMPMVNHSICQDRLREYRLLGNSFNLDDSFVCAGGEKGVDTSIGDGGGPLMCPTIEDNNRFVQVGVTSWGIRSTIVYPGVYSSVQAAAKFIEGDDMSIIDSLINKELARKLKKNAKRTSRLTKNGYQDQLKIMNT